MHNHKNKVNFREYILGGQDGLVNVLGIVLGVASATLSTNMVLISGIVATVAESISMSAVAYTSSKAAKEYENSLIKEDKKGSLKFREHKALLKEFNNPLKSAGVVGLSTLIGSIIPLVPFFFFSVKIGILFSLVFSATVLFLVGALKAKLSIGNWKKSGFELMVIGLLAAITGYLVGLLLKFFGLS
ncbi:VIT1/CCC1 transporter family protein [Candidatus Woesearchaeota archaeon]|nr:VIT1/CCC1 transporter family protein [Candidatus Woesearchaeota archaeon]